MNQKNKGNIVFNLPKLLIQDLESKSIHNVTSMCRNKYKTHVGHTGDDTVYRCVRKLLPFLSKCNTKFLEKSKGPLIFGSVFYKNMF